MMLTKQDYVRYARQIKLHEVGEAGQLKLKHARVLCVGAGGLGSPLLQYLAAMGVGTLGVIDHDRVDVSNLHRQILFNENDVGSSKALVIKHKLLLLNPEVLINAYDERLDAENAQNLMSEYDLIVDCSDNFATRYLINDACLQLKKPFISASIHGFKGQIGVFIPHEGACFRCIFPSIEGVIPDCNDNGVMNVLPGVLGLLQATEVMKYLIDLPGKLINQMMMIDLLTMQFDVVALSRNPDCDFHDRPVSLFNQAETCTVDQLTTMTPAELKEKMERGDEMILLDVRSFAEHHRGAIGTFCIPLNQLPARLDELDPSKDIIVYCQAGVRSEYAVEFLKSAGFERVSHLAGGMNGWS